VHVGRSIVGLGPINDPVAVIEAPPDKVLAVVAQGSAVDAQGHRGSKGRRCSSSARTGSVAIRTPRTLVGIDGWPRGIGRTPIEILGTPCRQGPPLTRPTAGDVIGFALRWPTQDHGLLWISGDTVL